MKIPPISHPAEFPIALDTPLLIDADLVQRRVQPLQTVEVKAAKGCRLRVTDSQGRVYVDQLECGQGTFRVSGALGWQQVEVLDTQGRPEATYRFHVTCSTRIDDGNAGFGEMLQGLHFTMLAAASGDGLGTVRFDGKLYRYFIRWLRDHTHVLKGMKYFSSELHSGLELYADTQRSDGMVYDRISPKPTVQGWRDHTFRQGDFIRTLEADSALSYTLQRIPVENDVEFLFIECLYRTWQATGDTPWMSQYLNHAIRAVAYATSDRYRWSQKFGLLKRGYTIDTWDFMHADDVTLTMGDNVCDPNITTFGIMHGDNTGMAQSCRMLAEMLEAAGRPNEAPTYRKLAENLLKRLENIAWDSRGYYQHHVTEDSSFVRDVGQTDESAQVSLSNAYALNREIGEEKSLSIIQTYQRIRQEMPEASPGEFYNLYPPFENGFQHNNAKWQYMNGGVSTIVAGELARGAFRFKQDAYGVDILKRLKALADRHGSRLNVCFNGNPQTTPPDRNFAPLNLGDAANVTATYRPHGGWGEPGNDLSQIPTGNVIFHHVPFLINKQGLGVGVAWDNPGYHREVRLPVNDKHASMYLLHTASQPATPTAELFVVYEDGDSEHIYLAPKKQLDSWFMPGSTESYTLTHPKRTPKGWPTYQLAWRGGNETFDNVGLFIWGWDNPRPDVAIKELVIRAAVNRASYFLPGVTFSDQPVWFAENEVSHGIPDSWGAAAVVYALIEGLAGVVDASQSFEHVSLNPRWHVADVNAVSVWVTYPASDGYVAYRCAFDQDKQEAELIIAFGGESVELTLPSMPEIDEASSFEILVNDQPAAWGTAQKCYSSTIQLTGPGLHCIRYRRKT